MSIQHSVRQALIAAACLLATPTPAQAQAQISAENIYQRHCASCHGSDGSGSVKKAKALKLDATRLKLGRPETDIPRAALREILLEGKNDMPAFKNKLKPAEVDPLLDYTIQLGQALRGGSNK